MDGEQDLFPLYAVWIGIMAAGAAAWTGALYHHIRVFGVEGGRLATGQVDLKVPVEKALQAIADHFAAPGGGLSARIGRRGECSLDVLISPGVMDPASFASSPDRRGRLVVTAAPRETGCRLSWTYDGGPLVRPMGAWSAGFLVAGAAALLLAAFAMPVFVIVHPAPAVRWQVIQTVHVLHFVWPPFIVALLARRRAALVRVQVEDYLANLVFSLRGEDDYSGET